MSPRAGISNHVPSFLVYPHSTYSNGKNKLGALYIPSTDIHENDIVSVSVHGNTDVNATRNAGFMSNKSDAKQNP